MKILLAGYNLDYDVIRELQAASGHAGDLTPETISAAYARISRSPKSVDELRKDARTEVEKSRKSNRNIVFEMGHSSVAEHAVFNIDVIGVSRLLVEEIEKFRLCAYTEKSQRYVLFKGDFVVPEEIRKAGLDELFIETVGMQNELYSRLYKRLRGYVFEQNKTLAAHPANTSLLEGWAKEDARYIISLATQTQLGMTVNARNLELMLRRLAALPLAEARLCSEKLYGVTKDIAPSLIRYTEATDYDRRTRANLRKLSASLSPAAKAGRSNDVRLVSATPDADRQAAAMLLFASSGADFDQCTAEAGQMTPRKLNALFQTAFEHLRPYDAVVRELENIDLQYELVMSASCFAQFKRHRMATLVSQDYDPSLGVTIPPAVSAIGAQKEFRAAIAQTNRVYSRLYAKVPQAAAYILTNAHRRRVFLKLSARELYHVARLRADAHAQWDIRNLAQKMLSSARRIMPRTLMMACGKDTFDLTHAKHFSRK